MNQWCTIVMRNLRCRNSDSNEEIIVEDVVTVYGPFSKAVALAKTERFNEGATAGSRVSFESAAPDEYRPIVNAPAFIDQEHWDEHWAIARPMNDVVW
jgi:hypothetical protein